VLASATANVPRTKLASTESAGTRATVDLPPIAVSKTTNPSAPANKATTATPRSNAPKWAAGATTTAQDSTAASTDSAFQCAQAIARPAERKRPVTAPTTERSVSVLQDSSVTPGSPAFWWDAGQTPNVPETGLASTTNAKIPAPVRTLATLRPNAKCSTTPSNALVHLAPSATARWAA
jgi:hypothetical protein